MIFAVDFDGTIAENAYPNIGKEILYQGSENFTVLEHLIKLQQNGHKIILWTCREGKPLKDALKWCLARGLIFDAVNDDLPQVKEIFNEELDEWKKSKRTARKIHADFYIDDKLTQF